MKGASLAQKSLQFSPKGWQAHTADESGPVLAWDRELGLVTLMVPPSKWIGLSREPQFQSGSDIDVEILS